MKTNNTSNNTKNSNGFEQFNANEEYIEYQKAMENLRKAQDKFLNKQRECMKRWHEENAKRYNAEMAKVMQKYNTTSFSQFYPNSAMPPHMNSPFSAAMPPASMTYCQTRESFYHYDIQNEKLFSICDAIMNHFAYKRVGEIGLAMLAEKVANIVDPAANLKINTVDPNKACFSITRRGPFGERVVRRTNTFTKE